MHIKTVKDIGLVIRDRRRELRMGQHALADAIGVSRQWIVQVEKGKPRAEAGLLIRALAALGLEIAIDQMKPSQAKWAPTPSGKKGQQRSKRNDPDGREYDVDIDAVIEKARGAKR